MKILLKLIVFSLVVLSCKNNKTEPESSDYAGDYIPVDTVVYKGAELRLRKLEENAYVVKLNEAAGIAKLKKGILSGTFVNRSGDETPFTLRILPDNVAVLRANERTISFIKSS